MRLIAQTLGTAALVLMLKADATLARDLSAGETDALQARIDGFEAAFENGDVEAVVGVVPPKIIALMAERSGVQPDELRDAMVKITTDVMANVTIVSYGMALDEASFAETSGARGYALIPTVAVMKVDGDTMQSNTQTLAFADEGVWHLVRIDDLQQVQLLTDAYPEFRGIDFPVGTMKLLEE